MERPGTLLGRLGALWASGKVARNAPRARENAQERPEFGPPGFLRECLEYPNEEKTEGHENTAWPAGLLPLACQVARGRPLAWSRLSASEFCEFGVTRHRRVGGGKQLGTAEPPRATGALAPPPARAAAPLPPPRRWRPSSPAPSLRVVVNGRGRHQPPPPRRRAEKPRPKPVRTPLRPPFLGASRRARAHHQHLSPPPSSGAAPAWAHPS